mgnify:CR=1 FL=1
MDNFWDIIKRVDIRSAEEYERASPDVRKKWHANQAKAYKLRLKNLQARVDVTDEESPQYKEMVELQELRRFHERQYDRIHHNLLRGNFYSLDLETDRMKKKGQQTPHGNPMPFQELSQEVYETLTNHEKHKYHTGMVRITEGEERKFHERMRGRISKNSKLPTFAASKYGGEKITGRTPTREEYENMTNDEKIKYHGNMRNRSYKIGEKDKSNFHNRMLARIRLNSKLPVFYSPEDEQ